MASEWYISARDGHHGPFSAGQLKQWAADGTLTAETFVRKGADGPWVLAKRIQGLVFAPAARKSAPEDAAEPLVAEPIDEPSAEEPPPLPVIDVVSKPAPPRAAPTAEPFGPAARPFPLDEACDGENLPATDVPHIEVGPPVVSERRAAPHAGSAAVAASDPKKRKLAVYGAAAGLGLIALAVGLLLVFNPFSGSSPLPPEAADTSAGPRAAPKPADAAPARTMATLRLDWPEDERSQAKLFLDGNSADVPAEGDIELELPPGDHRVELRRRGFQPIEETVTLEPGKPTQLRPEWVSVAQAQVAPKEFDRWVDRFEEAFHQRQQVEGAVAEFREARWVESFRKEDPELAARLYLLAAMLMFRTGHHEDVPDLCRQGLECPPSDYETQLWLLVLQDACRQLRPQGERIVGTGTAFCIADGGYLMTNHHVVAVAERVQVVLAGREAPLPAEILVQSAEADIALLKVQLPEGLSLPPVALAGSVARLGQRVAVLGYPFTGTNENSLTFIEGSVSSLPQNAGDGFIEIDSKVNPGNSGGPCFNLGGSVLGMVTQKKFFFDPSITPLGRMIPAPRLREFVRRNLPEVQLTGGRDGEPELSTEQLCAQRAASVVLVLCLQ